MQAYFNKDAVFYPYSAQRIGDSYYLVHVPSQEEIWPEPLHVLVAQRLAYYLNSSPSAEELRYRLNVHRLAAKILKFEQELGAVHA
jgi:molybdopterin-guanine dinucleotide biosynthesis protein A